MDSILGSVFRSRPEKVGFTSQGQRGAGSRAALAAGAVLVLLWLAVAGAAGGATALTTADVVRFLQAGISEHTILGELRERGFAEPLDGPREAALRAAGASETLVVAVRRVAPAPPAEPAPAPPSPARPTRGLSRANPPSPRARARSGCPSPSSTRSASR